MIQLNWNEGFKKEEYVISKNQEQNRKFKK